MNLKKPIAAALLLCVALPLFADESFTGKGTAQGGTNSYYIVPGRLGVPSVHFFDATVVYSDNTNGASVVWYTAGRPQVPTQAGMSGTNALYVNTNGWVIGDVLIHVRNNGNAQERHTVSAVNATSLTISGTTGGAVTTTDRVYRMTAAASSKFFDITTGSHATAAGQFRISALLPIFTAPSVDGRPAMIELQGTQTNTLNAVSGRYVIEAVQAAPR